MSTNDKTQFFKPSEKINIIKILRWLPVYIYEVFVEEQKTDAAGKTLIVKKPIRSLTKSDLEIYDVPIKGIMYYIIHNATEQRLQIFSISQKTILKRIDAISAAAAADKKDITEVDIYVSRSGSGMSDTIYNIIEYRNKKAEIEYSTDVNILGFLQLLIDNKFIDMSKLLSNEYPFTGAANINTTKIPNIAEIKISETIISDFFACKTYETAEIIYLIILNKFGAGCVEFVENNISYDIDMFKKHLNNLACQI